MARVDLRAEMLGRADARPDQETRQGSSPVLTCTPERDDAVDARLPQRAAAEVPPLPGGEGWGEGESQALFNFKPSPRMSDGKTDLQRNTSS